MARDRCGDLCRPGGARVGGAVHSESGGEQQRPPLFLEQHHVQLLPDGGGDGCDASLAVTWRRDKPRRDWLQLCCR